MPTFDKYAISSFTHWKKNLSPQSQNSQQQKKS